MDQLRDLSLFVEIARAKSFKKAAEHLEMPLSTVSRRITDLEARLGIQLLNRTTRQVELTNAGHAFFLRCEAIVEAAQAAINATLDESRQVRGPLHISLPVDFGVAVLLPMLVEFGQTHGELTFDLHFASERVDLIAEHFDLALRFGALPDSSLTARRIAVVRRGLFASPEYLESAGELLAPTQLGEHRCIVMPDAIGRRSWSLHRAEVTLEVAGHGPYVVNNVGALRGLAKLGHGIACLDLIFADEHVQRGLLARVLTEWSATPVDLYAVSTSRRSSIAARLLVDFLAERLTHC
jgi:DNA-binding transcriptional LysR family regulator